MRVIRALKSLITHYKMIMPTFIIESLLVYVSNSILPVFGRILVLPLKVSVAYAMIGVKIDPKALKKQSALSEGIRKEFYGKNLLYLILQSTLYILPLILGAIAFQLVNWFFDVENQWLLLILHIVLFAIPSAVLSLIFSMVPYLLADRAFDQRKQNPLFTSAKILRGYYIKLISFRLFFIPWLLWIVGGLAFSFVSLVMYGFSGESFFPGVAIGWLLSLPLTYLLILPWYHMTHAELYLEIRDKL